MTYKHLNKLRLQINKTFRCVRNLKEINNYFCYDIYLFRGFFLSLYFFRMDPLLLPWAKPLQHVSTLVRQFLFDLIFIAENVVLLSIALNSNIIELRVSQSPKLKTEYRIKPSIGNPVLWIGSDSLEKPIFINIQIIFLFSNFLNKNLRKYI